ncbi:MAG: S8/S53 family peptidase [Actinomycetota bacterium]|nr:S8/S53 family peptidase [Actinomycetota bacterium]
MSPNQDFSPETGPRNSIAERVLENPKLTFEVDDDGIVIAVKAELLVRRSARETTAELHEELSKIATRHGTLASIPKAPRAPDGERSAEQGVRRGYQPAENGPAGDIEIWRLTDDTADSIDEARRLRRFAVDVPLEMRKGGAGGWSLSLPAVSPNHVAILSTAHGGGCPASPPRPAPAPEESFVEPPGSDATARVTVLDSGYIYVAPPAQPHLTLNERVTLVDGERLDTLTNPASWKPDAPDGVDSDGDGRLDGIAGHGTFIAGLIAHMCPQGELTVVGLRNQEVDITGLDPAEQAGLFETEAAIAHAMLEHADTDVIQCGFAFPTLDDYPSLPFAAAMKVLIGPDAPRQGVAVVAPAGNEESRRRYWPAALPDVIGVASTNRHGKKRAWFSNWGDWCDCCTRGEDVYSTFVYWDGPIEGEPVDASYDFDGWARWDGTSFAAPKVSAAIACLVADAEEELLPTEAWAILVGGGTDVDVTELTDDTLPGAPVTLPRLHLE